MQQLGPYELLDVIGQGGMGRVWRARDTRYDRTVALKVIAEDKASEADFVKLFRREADLVARMNSPHIVPIHNYGEVRGQAYLDMRFVDGHSLSSVVREYGPATLDSALEIVKQAAAALDDAHASGVVHRDVKPANLLIDRKGFVYLADFGISVVDRHQGEANAQVLGSWPYMAPERFVATSPDAPQADVYGLACVLHYALTGHAPYPGTTLEGLREAHTRTPVPSLMGRVAGMTPAVDAAIGWALAKNPADRPASAGEWMAAVLDERRIAGAGMTSMVGARGVSQSIAQRPANHPAQAPAPAPSPQRTGRGASTGMSGVLLAVLFVLVLVAGALAAFIVNGAS